MVLANVVGPLAHRVGDILRLGAALADADSPAARLRADYPLSFSQRFALLRKAQARTGEPNNLVQSVLLTANWPKTHANYDDSQEILKDASEQILVLANRWTRRASSTMRWPWRIKFP
jgi:hypothetical protein